jgi:AsmA protein
LNKIIKYLAIAFGLAVIVFVAAIIIFALIFDPNDYKDEISALVESETGRKLTIEDDLSLSFFPWIGVESGAVIFSNAKGFGPDPFARIDSAKLSIKLLPLFKKQIEIDTVKVYGLSISLATNPQGITNWDDLVAKNSATSPAPVPGVQPPAQAPQTSGQALPLLAGLTVGGLDIRDAQLKWQDRQTNTGLILSKINFKSGPVSLNKPFDIELSFDMQNEQPAVRGTLNMATTLKIDIEQQRLQASNT